MPDAAARRLIWREHLPRELPLGGDVDVDALADMNAELSGREIKNAVVDAAIRAAAAGRLEIGQGDLVQAVRKLVEAREVVRAKNKPVAMTEAEKAGVAERIKAQLAGVNGGTQA